MNDAASEHTDPHRQTASRGTPGGRRPDGDRSASWLPPWPPQWPEITDSVSHALADGSWGRYHGRLAEQLRIRIGELGGCPSCRLLCSGSAGIELALRSVGISAGDKVLLCGYDYPGNFRAVELLGGRPVLGDAASDSYSLDASAVQACPADVKAVIVSHLYGVGAAVASIREQCDRRGFALIEDACQVPGMIIDGRPAGSWGNAAVFSFGGSKPLTAGNGGAVLTADPVIESRWNRWLDRPSDALPMSELQAAALLPQLDRLDACNRLRAESVQQILAAVPWTRTASALPSADRTSTLYKWAWQSDRRDDLITQLSEAGLPVGTGYRSMHRSSDRRCDKLGPLQRCQALDQQLCVLDHSALLSTGPQRDRVVEILNAFAA
ncbi:DegT/DnrJ/EryC1/StrS aminotransferase family protein [Roseiconus nitratireducens]|uniref:DegT/DnrJ/EryC1/StrS aminotransferase family protein n=1 Tax=Roseiconus nitratireducens TaxID=2605748 RepID=A0A5M6D6K9_9BACT|nr:DegT/DnrJ/EryC1/StrS aminotransferase family protein [Roseiconus nitratireducens]KAA5543174.1 DegT/DnrJ/EryC1/StrS aminotransferase family protein [Roseiconus nitratireducens]